MRLKEWNKVYKRPLEELGKFLFPIFLLLGIGVFLNLLIGCKWAAAIF